MRASLVEKRNPKKTRRVLNFMEGLARLSWLPTLSWWHPWLQPDKTDMRWLPINEDIEAPESAPMPLMLLDTIIDEASYRVLVDYCACREAFGCTQYPTDIGCLMMGDAAREVSPSVSRVVGPEEAKATARRAIEAGLVPAVGKARVDNMLFRIKDRRNLMTVCFCCECCCLTRFTRFTPVKKLEQLFPRLDGITIEVTDECTGCGTCLERCYLKAIRLDGGRAVIGECCRACGRCASTCPSEAIKIALKQADFLDRARERIRSFVKYD